MDSQPPPFVHMFSSVLPHRPIWEIVGAVKPVHISIWVDVFEGAGGTTTSRNTLNDSTTLWEEEHNKSFEINFNNVLHVQNIRDT